MTRRHLTLDSLLRSVRHSQGSTADARWRTAASAPHPAWSRLALLLVAACWLAPAGALVPLDSGIAKVAAGPNHTCAVTTGGAVKCWGRNIVGQLGDGTTTDRLTAVDVTGLTSGVAEVTAGQLHTCALTTAGGVKCWGYNGNRQLGDGTTVNYRATPANVVGLTSGVRAISAGFDHTCALLSSGGIKCWGSNETSQLGDGTVSTRALPVDVNGATSGMAAVASGRYSSCAVTVSGGVKCWGLWKPGADRTAPASDVPGLTSGVKAIAVHTDALYLPNCALTTTGGVRCWRPGAVNGQLTTAVDDVPGLAAGVAAIAVGDTRNCALMSAGGVKCWGTNSFSGALGDGTDAPRTGLVDVIGLAEGATAIAIGRSVNGDSTCVVTTGGGARCWGANNSLGQLGDGTKNPRYAPVDVMRLSNRIAAIAAGGYHTCAVTASGGVKCWGRNINGQLGDSTNTATFWPLAVDVPALPAGVTDIAAGEYHSCAVTAAGGVKCWGLNDFGQLGDGTTESRWMIDAKGLTSGVTSVATGYRHTCAVTDTGAAKCWGYNSNGQLGDATTANRNVPQFVPGLASGVRDIKAGQSHTCALTTQGGVKCWGRNNRGQLGDGTTTQRLTLQDVPDLTSGVEMLALGIDFTCALTKAGAVRCWGSNTNGQLGNGTIVDRYFPTGVSGLGSGVVAISAGSAQACALLATGGVKCWGFNYNGRLGDGTTIDRSVPVDVLGLTSGVSAIGVGLYHGCAVLQDGGVKCWGLNEVGQLGDNTTTERRTAVNTTFTHDVTATVRTAGGDAVTTVAAVPSGEMASFGYFGDGKPWAGGTCGGTLTDAGASYIYTTPFIYGACTVKLAPPGPPNYQGLWWNAQQSGWGINFAHQGDIIFATWFTYDAAGKPWWLIAELRQTAAGTYAGNVSTVTGPPFDSVPFDSAKVVETVVGTMTVTFGSPTQATLAYTVNGVAQTKAITKQVFGPVPSCTWGEETDLALATNYQDLWWNPQESGWGINFTHQGDIIFATWFTYVAGNRPWWLIAELRQSGPGVYSGPVSAVTGPAFDSVPFDPAKVIEVGVGNATVSFADGNRATFAYTVYGKSQTKPLTRQVFVAPGTVCR